MKLFGKEINGAIFDLDGTLLDSMWVWEKVDEDFLTENGHPPTKDYTQSIKQMHFNEAAEYTKRRYNLVQSVGEIKNRWIEMVKEEYATNIRMKEGAYEFVDYLLSHNVKVAFATTLFRQMAEPCLLNNGIDLNKCPLTTIEEVSRGKGFPDIYLKAAQSIFQDPSHCMIFEDIPLAIQGARSGGFEFCGVYDRYSNRDSEFESMCDNYIADFKDFLSCIKRNNV